MVEAGGVGLYRWIDSGQVIDSAMQRIREIRKIRHSGLRRTYFALQSDSDRLHHLRDSRFFVAPPAIFAIRPVDHCTLLHAGVFQRSVSRQLLTYGVLPAIPPAFSVDSELCWL